MIQFRTLLLFAWLFVAALLWLAWDREQMAKAVATAPAQVSSTQAAAAPPAAAALPATPATPTASVAAASASPTQAALRVQTDVLRVQLLANGLIQADLLRYPQTEDPNSPPVRLLDDRGSDYFEARSDWVGANGTLPSDAWQLEGGTVPRTLAAGQAALQVRYVRVGADGVTLTRTYTFTRGSYAVVVDDQIRNGGSMAWSGYPQRVLTRVPRTIEGAGIGHPKTYSFQGAAWYSPQDKYEKRKYDDFVADGALDKRVTGGWVAMLEHQFFAAWIPDPAQPALFRLSAADGRYSVAADGPTVQLAPGQDASSRARLWAGPKLVEQIQSLHVPGLDRAVDYSSYAPMAMLASWLFWVLEKLHRVFGNWGWAIVGLVVIIKLLMYPLSAAQYRSMAKMRKFQPRMQQLKERYGDDKQQYQMALMELYRKEKINPAGGCLPILLQMPVFLALYWMLSESVELRHAPWILWIHDLTAQDPYFILPALNVLIMWLTQKLSPPAPGMDPMQQKIMQIMPLAFGVMFAFFPAGLVLYWVTNGGLGLLQQWWMMKRYSEAKA